MVYFLFLFIDLPSDSLGDGISFPQRHMDEDEDLLAERYRIQTRTARIGRTRGRLDSLARAIVAILDDESHASRLGRHGHALARSRYSADSMAAAHEAMYASLARP